MTLDRPGPMIEVEWVDSAGHGEWHAPDEARELLDKLDCRSCGYLLHDETTGIVVTLGTGAVGQRLGSMAIPREAIRRVRHLRVDS